jgi:hypothetical protein
MLLGQMNSLPRSFPVERPPSPLPHQNTPCACKVWLPLGEVLTDMEARGMVVDRALLAAAEVSGRVDGLWGGVLEQAGRRMGGSAQAGGRVS